MPGSIDNLGPKPNFSLRGLHPQEQPKQPPETAPTAQQRTSTYDQAVQMADDLSAVLAQFRRRLDAEKRAPNSGDPFDRILEDEAEPKVEHLLFISNLSELSPQELLLQARALFPDDSDLILVLREIIKRRKLRNESTDVLEEVMQQVWAETNEKHCKAGINVGIKANLFAKKMEVTPGSLRDTYREFLTSGDEEVSQYEHWVEQYGNVRRQLVMEFIETALLHDIQSHDPSCSRPEFGALLNHVVNFRKLRASDKAFLEVFLKRERQQKQQEDKKEGRQEKRHQREGDRQKEQKNEQENDRETTPEAEVLTCWFDCLQRPFKVQKEIEKKQLVQLMERFKLSQSELRQKLIRAIQLLDGDLFFDAEAKQILLEALLNFDKKPSA